MPEEKQFVFKITSRLIERVIYILIILLLLVVLIVQNVYWMNNGDDRSTTATVATTLAGTTTTLAVTTTAAGAAASGTASTTTTRATTTTTTLAGDSSIAADIEFNGDPIADSTGKVTKVSFRIINRGSAFIPKVDFFWYDPGDEAAVKSQVRASWNTLNMLNPGQTLEDALEQNDISSTFTQSYVHKVEAAEVFYMKLYDRTSGRLLSTSTTKTITSVKVALTD